MTEKDYRKNRPITIHNSKMTFILAGVMLVSALLLWACTGPSRIVRKAADNILYEMGEQEALALVRSVMGQVLPDENPFVLKKPRTGLQVHETVAPGYQKYARFRDATYIYEVDLLLSTGVMPSGGQVTGYTYAVKGSGDLKTGPETLVQLEQQLKAAFDGSGRAAAVSSVGPAAPAPSVVESKPAPPAVGAEKPVTTVIPSKKPTAKDADVFDKLRKLKDLRDQEVISEEEFQSKKRELLDRI